MYLAEVHIENFRTFGLGDEGKGLSLKLRPGLNILAGENDSGKTAVIDAIRHVLWTTSFEYHRLSEDDFHVTGSGRATSLRISCVFTDLCDHDAARFLEWLSIDDEGKPALHVTLQATRLEEGASGSGRRGVAVSVRSGKKADGPAIEGEIREFLRVTYLRPLRDAEAELAAGKGSRLSQILRSHPDFEDEGTSDYDPAKPTEAPKTLVGIMHQAELRIADNEVVQATRQRLNDEYLNQLSIGEETLSGSIGVARSTELRQILEKLELWLEPPTGTDLRTPRGLGFNNALFMATELLLLGQGADGAVPMLLIEEPEAHLHPQMQLRLMEFLEDKASRSESPVQVLVTTHSPSLSSKANLEAITLIHEGRAFSLASECTKLDPSDYRFLQRFLDVTKANLFFAKAVAIVEGDAENILLPVLADLLGRSFARHGVSVVNVGSRGLFRYSRILQRKDGVSMPIRVACLADRDIPSKHAAGYVPKRKNRSGEEQPTYDSDFSPAELQKRETTLQAGDEGSVQTFVSPAWTFEHDLATGKSLAEYLHVAIQMAKKLKGKAAGLSWGDVRKTVRSARQEVAQWRANGLDADTIAANTYEDLFMKRASKAETAHVLAELLLRRPLAAEKLREELPDYIVDSIDYVTGRDAAKEGADATGD